MRIIHTGDIHLESPLDSALPTEKAVVRRNELLKTFEKLVTFAIDNFVEVIIIAKQLLMILIHLDITVQSENQSPHRRDLPYAADGPALIQPI